MMTTTHQPLHARGTDSWLTPLPLITALGPFDLDPCCHDPMPWRTAANMVFPEGDGLADHWWRRAGRVWMNPPYSDVLPWAERFVAHGNGIALISAKSVDARWAQLLLREASAIHILAGRLVFHRPDGTPADGKWLSNLLVAVDRTAKAPNAAALRRPRFLRAYPGVGYARR